MVTEKKHVTLRLRPALLQAVKVKAKKQGVSMNKYVEMVLEREIEKDFPRLNRKEFVKENEFYKFGKMIPPFTEEQLERDPKLRHILGENN